MSDEQKRYVRGVKERNLNIMMEELGNGTGNGSGSGMRYRRDE